MLRDQFHWDACDDPGDNRILECAIEAGSDYNLTLDNDLLRLKEYEGIQIITPAAFFGH